MSIYSEKMAKIAINKSLVKEYIVNYDRTVFLKNGDEFQIQLFNPHSFCIAAKIYINGDELQNKLVLRPGERVWLDRYLNTPRKFKFETYNVESNNKQEQLVIENAIKSNGDVKIEFFAEIKRKEYRLICDSNISDNLLCGGFNYDNDTHYGLTGTALNNVEYNAITTNDINFSSKIDCILTADSKIRTPKNIKETGRISEGSYSTQSMTTVNKDFAKFSFETEYIKILPISEKLVNANDLHKKYCVECGHKINNRYKYCPNCGTKIE